MSPSGVAVWTGAAPGGRPQGGAMRGGWDLLRDLIAYLLMSAATVSTVLYIAERHF